MTSTSVPQMKTTTTSADGAFNLETTERNDQGKSKAYSLTGEHLLEKINATYSSILELAGASDDTSEDDGDLEPLSLKDLQEPHPSGNQHAPAVDSDSQVNRNAQLPPQPEPTLTPPSEYEKALWEVNKPNAIKELPEDYTTSETRSATSALSPQELVHHLYRLFFQLGIYVLHSPYYSCFTLSLTTTEGQHLLLYIHRKHGSSALCLEVDMDKQMSMIGRFPREIVQQILEVATGTQQAGLKREVPDSVPSSGNTGVEPQPQSHHKKLKKQCAEDYIRHHLGPEVLALYNGQTIEDDFNEKKDCHGGKGGSSANPTGGRKLFEDLLRPLLDRYIVNKKQGQVAQWAVKKEALVLLANGGCRLLQADKRTKLTLGVAITKVQQKFADMKKTQQTQN